MQIVELECGHVQILNDQGVVVDVVTKQELQKPINDTDTAAVSEAKIVTQQEQA